MLKNFPFKWYFHDKVDFRSNFAVGLNLHSVHMDLNTILCLILQRGQFLRLLLLISTADLVMQETQHYERRTRPGSRNRWAMEEECLDRSLQCK